MTSDSDTDLRERLQGLREHDHASAPAFETVLARAPARALRGRRGLAWAAGGRALVVVLIAAAGLFLILHRPANEPDVVAVAAWHSPTDFLLADAASSVQRLSWTPSPTTDFDRTSFNPHQETR
jgi:hypothetical protein